MNLRHLDMISSVEREVEKDVLGDVSVSEIMSKSGKIDIAKLTGERYSNEAGGTGGGGQLRPKTTRGAAGPMGGLDMSWRYEGMMTSPKNDKQLNLWEDD